MRLVAACLLALLLLAACGGEDEPAAPTGEPGTTEGPPETTTEQSAAPAGEPPVTEEGGPPPAWIETPAGSAWMAYGRYLWAGLSVEIAQVTCDDSSVPQLELPPGGTVRFHLPFEPRTAELTLGADTSRPEVVQLAPARVIEWQGDYDGHLWLALTADEGEVAYQACVRVPS
jgi:hypothetical protein